MTKPIAVQATLFWASLQNKNEMSDKYQVDLGELSDKAVMALEGMGIDVKNKEGQGNYVTVKSANPIKVFDANGMPIDPNVKVGNGSKAKAALSFYDWTYKAKSGRSPSLVKMIITDLIEYGDSADIDDLDFI